MSTQKQPAKATPPVLGEEEFNKKWDQENLYQNVKRTNDPRFGEITVVKNSSTGEILFVKEKMASSKQEASNDIRELKSRIALNHPHMQKLVNYSTAVKKELCSTHYLSRGFYEFPRSDAQKEHLERKRNLAGFSGSELTHLAYQTLDGLNHLHSRNITHGDIRPLTLGYNKQAGQFQILDRLADASPLERLQAANIVNKKELYLAPELYKKLGGGDKNLKYNAYKNDLYGLGLTLLHLGTSDSVQDVYKPQGVFDQKRLDEHLANFNAKYQGESPYLCNIVRTLLATNEADRPESQQLLNSLIPYDQFRQQDGLGIKIQGGAQVHSEVPQAPVEHVTQTQIYAAPQTQTYAAPQQDFFSYTTTPQTQTYAQPTEKVIINRAEHEAQAAPEPAKYGHSFSGLNTTQENTNVTYTYGQPTTNYTYAQAPTTYQSNTVRYENPSNVTYMTNQSYDTYSHAQPATYTYAQPTTTYTQAEPTTTYTYTQPTTTYSYAQPTTTYTQAEPTTTYTYAQPTTTYTQGEPTTTYTYAQPANTYVQGEPTTTYTYAQPTTTYVQGEPTTNYTYSQPTTTYSYAQPSTAYYQTTEPVTYSYAKPNATFVNANIDTTKTERKSYTTYTIPGERKSYKTYAAPVERKSYTQVVTGIDGIKTVRRSYTHYVQNPDGLTTTTTEIVTPKAPVTYVYSQPYTTYQQNGERKSYSQLAPTTTTTYVQSTPTTTYVQGTPTTTYVQGTPTTTYVQGTAAYTYAQGTPTYSYAQSTPTYSYSQPSTVYTNYQPATEHKVEGGEPGTYATTQQNEGVRTYYVNDPATRVQASPYTSPYEGSRVIYASPDGQNTANGNVEIRRGSFAPTQTETKVIKKKYIIEGDKVIEVDANEHDDHHTA